MKKTLFQVIKYLGATTVVVALLGAPIIVLSQLSAFYFGRAQAYGIYQSFSQEQEEVETQLGSILTYLRPGTNTELDPIFFSMEDRLHMQDVKNTLIAVFFITFACLSVALIIFIVAGEKTRLGFIRLAKKYFTLALTGLAILGIIFALFWDQTFSLFHQVLFPLNTFWQLDPATSNLIKFFPPGIFQELGFLYLFQILLEYCAIHLVLRLLELKHASPIKK